MKLEELQNRKCAIADCEERQAIYLQITPIGTYPFCTDHATQMILIKPIWVKTTDKIVKDMKKSDGSTVEISSFEELKRRMKTHFFEACTQGLELTKGKCMDCGKKAEAIVTFMKPVCGKHMGWPRNFLKVTLKQ